MFDNEGYYGYVLIDWPSAVLCLIMGHYCYVTSISSTAILFKIMGTLWWYSHTWAWQEGSAVMTPVFLIFDSIGSIFHASTRSDWSPLSAKNKWFVAITFSSSNTILLVLFLHFASNFSLNWFLILLTPFLLILDLFDTSFL